MKLSSWKEGFEGRLDSSGIFSVEVSHEEECDVTKHTDECEDENLSLYEECKVAKIFQGKKKSNEEEYESIFLGSFEKEGEWRIEGGKELSELIVSMKDLDTLPFLKIVSTFLY